MSEQMNTPSAELAALHPDQWTEPFWSSARDHRLVAPRCERCDRARMPPGPFCTTCGEVPIVWRPATGAATLHTFTIARQPFHPALRDAIPYAIAVVALDDHPDVRLVTNLVDIAEDEIRIGMRLQVRWTDIDETTTIPRFGPAPVT